MPTLLLSPPYHEDSQAIWEAALEAGWNVERVQGWSVPKELEGQDLAYYGFLKPQFARMLMEALSRSLLEPPLDWLTRVPDIYLKRKVVFATLKEARALANPMFVKPAEDKSFPARVYLNGSHLPSQESLSETLPVLIVDPVEWEVEYRCFVLEGEVMTLSAYWRNGRTAWGPDEPSAPAERKDLLQWTSVLLSDPRAMLPAAVVLDVGWITGRGWAAVECNPAWAAALYGCSPRRILPVLERACVKGTQQSKVSQPT